MPAKGFSKFDIDLKYGQIREDKVREFMNTEDWQNMLAGVFVIPKGVNLQF